MTTPRKRGGKEEEEKEGRDRRGMRGGSELH
jgi:hypothetical protein